jgi:hypothetical protein
VITTILAAGTLAMSSIYSPTFASNFEISEVFRTSLTSDVDITRVNIDATGESQFESNAQAAALGELAAAACQAVIIQMK